MKYLIPVRFTGKILFEIEAPTEAEAIAAANLLGGEADCGDLREIDWEAKPAVDQYEDKA